VFKTTLPKIMRDLVPISGFNPVEVWEQEKEREQAQNRQDEVDAKSKEREGGKSRKPKKADLLVAQNISSKADVRNFAFSQCISNFYLYSDRKTSFIKDVERIRNKKNEGGLISIRRDMKTAKGRLVLLVEILNAAAIANDRKLAYDVLWAIEAMDLYKKVNAFLNIAVPQITFTSFSAQKEIEFDLFKPEGKKVPALVFDEKTAVKKVLDKVIQTRPFPFHYFSILTGIPLIFFARSRY